MRLLLNKIKNFIRRLFLRKRAKKDDLSESMNHVRKNDPYIYD